MFVLRELKDIPAGCIEKSHYDQHRNNYSIPHKIRPVQGKIEIRHIFSFFKFLFFGYIQIASKYL